GIEIYTNEHRALTDDGRCGWDRSSDEVTAFGATWLEWWSIWPGRHLLGNSGRRGEEERHQMMIMKLELKRRRHLIGAGFFIIFKIKGGNFFLSKIFIKRSVGDSRII
ncbi:hypothetical protein PanWU01x14_223690, partial [Parasponia andersonii]